MFSDLDRNQDGEISADELVRVLQDKLPEGEVNAVVEDALREAQAEGGALDFDAFARAVRMPSSDSLQSLDNYDARLAPRPRHRGSSCLLAVLGG